MNAPAQGMEERGAKGRRAGLLAGFFHRQLDRIDLGIREGSLELHLPTGGVRVLGGRAPGPAAVVTLERWRALRRLALGGSGGWYEAWADEDWHSPDPVQLFALFSRNRQGLAELSRASGPSFLLRRATHWLHRNSRRGSRRNIHFHYDLGNDFYRQWLDRSMTYSSALFANGAATLEDAQQAKLQAILERTATATGEEILEVGCGWGSFAELAVRAGRRVHGITLSSEQKRWAEDRMLAAGVSGARFSLVDYRDISGTYDAIASIEMAEAVGREYWPGYLSAIARLLKPGGQAALQIITFDDPLFEGYARSVDFIQTYVFPGGMLIRESEFRQLAAERGLGWTDARAFGLDYAETLRLWRERFDAAASAGTLPAQFDERFVQLWRYYLMYCEGGFRGGGIDVVQVTLVREG